MKKIDPLQGLKGNSELNRESLSLSKQLSAENLYRTLAIALFTLMIIVAFFVSLANAEFNWAAIGTAQFWIDFGITFGGGQILKWAFGKFGNAEGHKHPAVKKALTNLDTAHTRITDLGLVELLSDFVLYNNHLRKIRAIRKKVFIKLNSHIPFKGKWRKQKEAIKIYEKYLETVEGSQLNLELATELDAMNFDIDGYKIKYSKINKAALQTGFNSGDVEGEEQMAFNEMYELFGKSSIITMLSIAFSILLAVSSVSPDDAVSLTTFIIFFTRVLMFALNSYVGFVTGKGAVERIKLNILININNFLQTFLEANKKPMGSLSKIVFPREQTEVTT